MSRSALRGLIPAELDVDEYDGSAWLGIAPFWISRFGLRRGPILSTHLPELNVRTYVTDGTKPGVWFFSLDTTSRIAVWGARILYHLPYRHADMKVEETDGTIAYRSALSRRAVFRATYGPIGDVALAAPGSIDHWLTERYALYAVGGGGTLYRAEIDHVPWPLQSARATITLNDVPESVGLPDLRDPPALTHFARALDVSIWMPERLR